MTGFDPTTAFKEYLKSEGFEGTIYARQERPTSDLPDVFVDVDLNGSIRTLSECATVKTCTLLVGIYVKLLTTDAANSLMEDSELEKFSSLLSRKAATYGEYHFQISNDMVSQGKDVNSGYSYMLMNVNTFIY